MTPDRRLLWAVGMAVAFVVLLFMASVFWYAIRPYQADGYVRWQTSAEEVARSWLGCLRIT